MLRKGFLLGRCRASETRESLPFQNSVPKGLFFPAPALLLKAGNNRRGWNVQV